MHISNRFFELRLAKDACDISEVQRLRYAVFVEELGVTGPTVDHSDRREGDSFDAHADHLMLLDHRRPAGDALIGTYRVMRADQAQAAGGYCTEAEFELAALLASRTSVLELGRACLHPDYRGGAGMLHLWRGVAAYAQDHGATCLFGLASFPGTAIEALAQPLSLLHHAHLLPEPLRPVACGDGARMIDPIPPNQIERVAATAALPALVKAYLRLGGAVGEGAYIDADFGCTDVCLALDIHAMPELQRSVYAPI